MKIKGIEEIEDGNVRKYYEIKCSEYEMNFFTKAIGCYIRLIKDGECTPVAEKLIKSLEFITRRW